MQDLLKELGQTYEPVIYEEAGHGFVRAGEDPSGSEVNKKARLEVWQRIKEVLKTI